MRPTLKGHAAVMATMVVVVAAPPSAPAREHSCGALGFARSSSDTTGDIVAHGVSCGTARAVAARTRSRRYRPYGRTRRFVSRGFSCSGTDGKNGGAILAVHYRCRRGRDALVFDRF